MSSSHINVKEIIQSPHAMTTDAGELVYNIIDEHFQHNKEVIVDFKDISLIISTFLNASIGQLYGKYDTKFIQSHLVVQNMTSDDLFVLKLVVDTAKDYFKDKKGFANNHKNFPNAD